MIKVSQLSHIYPGGTAMTFPDFAFEQGEQALILGQSGCGKTTLLHLLCGILRPKKGCVVINGTDLSDLSGAQLDKFRGENIGIVFQSPHFVDALSVKENLHLAQYLAGRKRDVDEVQTLLEELGIGHKLNVSVKALSQGEKQRVTIARALINKPALILADEPTSALDHKNCESVVNLLKGQAEKCRATLLIVTHDNRLDAMFNQKLILA
jgi:putative ABC transport system ATP-binding protein